MPVDRAFSVKGTGTVVTGAVWSGEVELDSIVRVLPADKRARVRRIEQHGQTITRAGPGNRTAIALAGVGLDDVSRGSVLVSDESWRPSSIADAVVTLSSDAASHIRPRTRLQIHAGAAETGGRLRVIGDLREPGEPMLARLAFDSPLVLRGGDRLVLRLPAPLRTIGGGVVVDPFPSARKPRAREVECALLSNDAVARFQHLLDIEGPNGLRISEIAVRVGCAPDDVLGITRASEVASGPHNLFARASVEQVMATVQRIVAEYELRSPLSPGIPSRTLREEAGVSEELADISIRELETNGRIETDGPLIRRKGWAPSPTPFDVEASNHLVHDICAATAEPPSVSELVSRYGSSVPGLLRYLEREGRIVQVEADRYYDRGALEGMIAKLKGKLVPGEVYVPAQLRDVLGSSRKYLIPFLEFCDRRGITERRGEGRMLRQTPGVLLDTPRRES